MKKYIDERYLLETAQKDGISRISVGAIVFRNHKILIIKRNASDFLGGNFELPGGTVKNETVVAGLLRETFEETHLKVTNIVDYYHAFDYQIKAKKIRQYNFIVRVKPGKIRCNPQEHDQFSWIGKKDMGSITMTPEMKQSIVMAFQRYETI